MGRFLYWVSMTHSARHHAHYHTAGCGHLYQGRFKSFPVQDDDHFLVVCRYTEQNALAAGLVTRAEVWKWGSLWNWCGNPSKIQLASWPIPRSPRWVDRVNQALGDHEQKKLQRSLRRGCPFGDDAWVQSTAERLSLGSTLREPGRPRKFA